MANAPASIIVVTVSGAVDQDGLQRELTAVTGQLTNGTRRGIVFDASQVTSYTPDARSLFVQWNAAHRDRITRVAVVTDQIDWVQLVQAVGMESHQTMKAFTDRTAAEAWVR